MRVLQPFSPTIVCIFAFFLSATTTLGQTTSFTYQGRLTDSGTGANGNYDLQFALWDSQSAGTQIGSTLTINTVAVSNGAFTISLDFGAGSFNGASRFLEISTRPSGVGSFTLLTPRQQVTSTPYSVRSLSAASADNVSVTGVPAGNGNYVQNTTTQQSSTNFNISGNGIAGGTLSGSVLNATSQYNLGNSRVLSASSNGVFLGFGAGNAGTANTFMGSSAGGANTTGQQNSFVGTFAGSANIDGVGNAFFGYDAGEQNSHGTFNTFLGQDAGSQNTIGNRNVFVGIGAGSSTTDHSNITGSDNVLIGSRATVGAPDLTNAGAIGSSAFVTQNNSLVLGSINGVNGATADTNVGIGTTSPLKRLEVSTLGVADGIDLAGTAPAYYISGVTKTEKAALGFASSAGLYSADAAAGDTVLRATSGRLILQHGTGGAGLILNSSGTVSIPTLGSGGGTPLCRNSSNEFSTCSSSLRYKTNVARFSGGMNIINRLRPISFEWKQDHVKDIGLGAEEVERIEPLLTFRNDKGEIEGVKYNQLSAVFINAFKEQQAQISHQQKQLREQESSAALQQVEIKRLNSRLQAIERALRRQSSSRK